MKKGIVILGLPVIILVSFSASLAMLSANLNTKAQKIELDSASKLKVDKFKQDALAKFDSYKSKYVVSQQAKRLSAEGLLPKLPPGSCLSSNVPVIENIGTIEPGIPFAVVGKGFGSSQGIITVEHPTTGQSWTAYIIKWTSCYVHAQLGDGITGITPFKGMLVLRAADGKGTSQTANFQPLLEYRMLPVNTDELWAGQRDYMYEKSWTVNGFNFINGWIYYDNIIGYTVSPEVNISSQCMATISHVDSPPSASLSVKASVNRGHHIQWVLSSVVVGPKGTNYR